LKYLTKMMNTIKQQVKAGKDPPRLLLSRASTSFSKGASTSCSSLSNISRTIRQVRSLEHVGPSIPKCLEDVVVTEKYQKTDKGEQFLLFDSKDKDRILMFATRRNLDFPIKSQEWFMDGTFKIVPKLFYQLFTIHGNINGAYVLAFVRVEYVTNAFDILLDNEHLCYTDIKPLIEYFEQTWIGKMERKERRPPMYEHSLWNFYERNIHGQQRTNNVVEGWHSSMGKTFQAKEPSV
jgi:hypothetical protein